MFADPLAARWGIIGNTQRALRAGGSCLENVPGLLKRLIREDMWHEYMAPNGEVMHFTEFGAFLTSQWGLSTTLGMLQRICGDDLEALDLLDTVTTAKPGGAKNPHGCKGKAAAAMDQPFKEELFETTKDREEDGIIHNNVMNDYGEKSHQGNSRTYALRRLRDPVKGRPDIHARVLAGELSPHQGMLEAGFRHEPTPLDHLHRYWRKVSPEDRLRFLTEMLTDTLGPLSEEEQGCAAPRPN